MSNKILRTCNNLFDSANFSYDSMDYKISARINGLQHIADDIDYLDTEKEARIKGYKTMIIKLRVKLENLYKDISKKYKNAIEALQKKVSEESNDATCKKSIEFYIKQCTKGNEKVKGKLQELEKLTSNNQWNNSKIDENFIEKWNEIDENYLEELEKLSSYLLKDNNCIDDLKKSDVKLKMLNFELPSDDETAGGKQVDGGKRRKSTKKRSKKKTKKSRRSKKSKKSKRRSKK